MANSFSLDFLKITPESLTKEVGLIEYNHNEKNQSGTAYPSSEGVSLLLYIPGVIAARNLFVNIYGEAQDKILKSYDAKKVDANKGFDVFEVEIPSGTLSPELYFFDIEIDSFIKLYGFKDGQNICFSTSKDVGDKFQFTVFDAKYSAPRKNYGGIIYHIFVDRFNRGGSVPTRSDAVLIDDWNSDITEFPAYPGAFLKNNTFYGGTLWGVADKLDYLKSLGVTTIYLSPIFEAYSNHKYDTGDYGKVDEMFGGEEALTHLIKEAQKREIGIVLDGVFNHTGSDSIYFNKNGRYDSCGAYQSTKSQYYDWYTFNSHPNDYTSWWGIEILPRINPAKKACADFFIGKDGIIEKYASMGIDGFRLDVADELPDEFIAGIKQALNNKNKTSILYGEVWEDASNKIAYDKRKKYYLGAELDGVMNYPVRTGIIDYILNKSVDALKYALTEVFPNMPKRIRDAAMNLLGTHDTERILTTLSGVGSSGYTNTELKDKRLNKHEYERAVRRLKAAYTINATLPGIPSIYYGDEVGMEGYSDPFNRRTFPWGKENRELLSHYVKIGKIRTQNEVYKEGEFELIHLSGSILIFKRYDDKANSYITVFNNSNEPVSLSFSSDVIDLTGECEGKSFTIDSESASIYCAKRGISLEI